MSILNYTKEELDTFEKKERLKRETIEMMAPDVIIDENDNAIGADEEGVNYFDYFGREPKLVIPEGVTKIYYKGLQSKLFLEEVIVPSSVRIIEDGVFANCKALKKVYIPKTCKEIYDYSFYGCEMVTVYTEKGSAAEAYAMENNIDVEYI